MLLASIAAAFPLASQAAPVARVDFAVGNVMAVAPTGQTRQLAKGAQVEEGETVNTNAGRAQLRFVDGAYVSLQPESEFRIDQYRYEGREDGSENALLSLFKGGLRTITGFIGRSNKKNYQVTTTVATIGIRGTEYTIQYGESIRGTVGDGQIEVCNGAGCLNVTDGETYYVANQDTQPVLTNKGTDLPPAPPESPPQKFTENENVDEEGNLCTLFPEQCLAPSTTTILTGTITANVAAITTVECEGPCVDQVTIDGTTATLSNAGALVSFGSQTLNSSISNGNDGIIAWGTAPSSTGGEFSLTPTDTIHYVVGAPSSNVSALGGLTGTYSLLGGTDPTGVNSGLTSTTNKLNSADLSFNFADVSASGFLRMSWTLEGQSINTAGSVSSFSGPTFSGNLLDTDQLCSGTCASAFVNGFFVGSNAERAGLSYHVTGESLSDDGHIGAAALTQTGLTLSDIRLQEGQ
ncbi:MAG: FecR family protein [Burkholderiales bacterium]